VDTSGVNESDRYTESESLHEITDAYALSTVNMPEYKRDKEKTHYTTAQKNDAK